MEWKKINRKDGRKELVYIWKDKSITDIVYASQKLGRFEIENDHRAVMSQYNTYGEKAAKELAEHYAWSQSIADKD